MAPPSYSVRFIKTTAGGVWTSWTCPAGYRAVVRDMTFYHGDGSTPRVVVQVAGVSVYTRTYQVAEGSETVTCRLVCYAGETVSVFLSAPPMHASIGGFLFADPAGRHETQTDGEPDLAKDPPGWYAEV